MDPNAPKRLLLAFLFCSEYCFQIKGEPSGLVIGDIGKLEECGTSPLWTTSSLPFRRKNMKRILIHPKLMEKEVIKAENRKKKEEDKEEEDDNM
jgi:hypothetical protein